MRYELALGLLVAAAASGEVIYRNDFSTRTGVGTIPEAEWHELTYHTGTLYYNYTINDKTWFDEILPWRNEEEQDGWAKANIDRGNMTAGNPGFLALTDGVIDNPCALFRSSSKKTGTAIHSIHNEFTNGIVRIEADIRHPAVWGGTTETYTCRVAPIYRKYLDPNWGVGVNDANTPIFPVMFGTIIEGNGSNAAKGVNRPVFYYGNQESGRPKDPLYPGKSATPSFVCETNHWYRWRVYVDIERGRSNAYLWDAGETQPDGPNLLADATATRKVEAETYYFAGKMTKATGGIAGLCLNCYRTLSGTDANFAITNAPCFDNLRVAWKAPDGKDYKTGTYELVYENDFRTRRYRTLCPAGTNTFVYPLALETSTNSSFTAYQVNTNRDLRMGNNFYRLVRSQASTPEPIGTDNWRRLGGSGTAAVINSNTAGEYNLRLNGVGTHIVVGARLCESVSSGVVRVSADVRLPKSWKRADSRRVCLALGSLKHWEGTGVVTDTEVGYGAIMGDPDQADTVFAPSYIAPQPAALLDQMSSTVSCTGKNWYRMVVTADLDRQTYDYDLYDLGNVAVTIDTVATNLIYSVQDIAFRNDIREISSFSLWNYGMGDDWDHYILWDSIKVWKNWDGTAGKLLYQNTFNTRYHYFDRERTRIDGEGGVNRDDGLDGWMRRLTNSGNVWLAGDSTGNRFLRFKASSGQKIWLQHDLGTLVTRGRVKCTVDMRPPDVWGALVKDGTGTARVNFYLGGETFRQGNCSKEDFFYEHSLMTWGFYTNGARSIGNLTNVTVRILDGPSNPGVVEHYVGSTLPSHWYRFVGTTMLGSGVSTVKVYDMGTTHPEPETPLPAQPFATLDNVRYRGELDEGVASFAITAGSVCGWSPWDEEDSGCLLFDNVVVEKLPSGTCIIVR